jgi:DMSO reductase family type II enzyme chaperone
MKDICSGEIGNPVSMSRIYGLLADAFRYPSDESSKAASSKSDRPSGAEFLEVFDPALSKDACSLREASYATEDMDVLLEDLIRFYSYFGLKRGESSEMPDHISVELEFMHFLSHMEESVEHTVEDAASLHRAQRDFLARHVVRLAQGIRQALGNRHVYYSGQIETCIDLVSEHLDRLNEAVGFADSDDNLPSGLMVGGAAACSDQSSKSSGSTCQYAGQTQCGV